MSFSVGIVGLPNVGKSTLFNALTKQAVPASNFPFTTIDPNIGVIQVPDERLEKLAALEKSEKIVPTHIEFVDIAGLVKGAAEGAGLGNQFLSHIREVDAIAQVVRAFENKDIIHVDGSVDPKRDIEVINLELILADLSTVNKRLESLTREIKPARRSLGEDGSGDKEAVMLKQALEKIKQALDQGQMASTAQPLGASNLLGVDPERSRTAQRELAVEPLKLVAQMQLLTMKPILYLLNTPDVNFAAAQNTSYTLPIDIKLEAELSELSEPERKEYMKELSMKESGLDRLINAAYKLLNLITFITAGPKETKAWTVVAGTKAPQAAGKIHTDFERGFIAAEIIAADKLWEAGSYAAAREKGWLRLEGKDYVIADGDVVHFRFNV